MVHTPVNNRIQYSIDIDSKYRQTWNDSAKYLMWYPWFWIDRLINPKKKWHTTYKKYRNEQWKCFWNTFWLIRNYATCPNSRAWKVPKLDFEFSCRKTYCEFAAWILFVGSKLWQGLQCNTLYKGFKWFGIKPDSKPNPSHSYCMTHTVRFIRFIVCISKSYPMIDATGSMKHAISQMLMKFRYFSFWYALQEKFTPTFRNLSLTYGSVSHWTGLESSFAMNSMVFNWRSVIVSIAVASSLALLFISLSFLL